jgi:hypothetical protein
MEIEKITYREALSFVRLLFFSLCYKIKDAIHDIISTNVERRNTNNALVR